MCSFGVPGENKRGERSEDLWKETVTFWTGRGWLVPQWSGHLGRYWLESSVSPVGFGTRSSWTRWQVGERTSPLDQRCPRWRDAHRCSSVAVGLSSVWDFFGRR